MFSTTRLLLALSLVSLWTLSLALGQEVGKDSAAKNPIVTASVTADGVRIAAPSAAVQLRLEVYDDAGQKLFDTEQSSGNLLDWHLQGSAGGRIADGTYLCVVTVKDPAGRQSQRLGLVTVNAQSATLRAAGATELSLPQAQIVGPNKDEDQGLTVVPAENVQPVTVLAQTGDEAQLARTRGPLSFRLGDFFSADDKEQMRITPDGRVGIGTVNPQATLDVAGTVRAQDGIVFGDGTVLKSTNDLNKRTVAGVTPNSTGTIGPNVAGTGTTGKLSKWTDNSGTLGDSAVTELNGNIGIGTANPASTLHLSGPGGVSAMTLDTPGSHKFRFQTVPNVPNWGAFTLNANYNAGWRLDDTATNGWFFKLDTRGGNAANDSNGLWLWRVPNGANPHTDEYPVFGVTNGRAFFADNVGINTSAPTQKLEVNGNVKVSGAGNGILFPDGSKQTTASTGGGSMTGTQIVAAINDPATSGVIGDARLSPNVAHVNSANTFTGNQVVNGDVSVNGTLNATALSLNGTQTFPGWITGGSLQVNNANIRTLNADAGTLWVESSTHRVGVHTVVPQYDLDVRGSLGASSVNAGFVTFPDGSTQGTAAPVSKVYTTSPTGDIEVGPRDANGSPTLVSVLQLNLPVGSYYSPVTYMVDATVQFENTANLVFQNNTRLVTCKIGNDSWSFRLGAPGSPMDRQPISVQAVVTLQQYVNEGPVKLSCGASDGGTDRSYVFAKARRFTASRMEGLITQ